MERNQREYLRFLLRLWRAGEPLVSGTVSNWRASLESPQRGERIGFGSLEELFTFLVEEVTRCEGENMPLADHGQCDL